jgi:hypothetical protein
VIAFLVAHAAVLARRCCLSLSCGIRHYCVSAAAERKALSRMQQSRPATRALKAEGTAVEVPDALTLWVFPPAHGSLAVRGTPAVFSVRVYDDDGVSMAYSSAGAYWWTNVTCSWAREISALVQDAALEPAVGADSVTCTIGPAGGGVFPEMPLYRTWTVRFIATWPPAAVTVGGALASASPAAVPDAWGDHAAWPRGHNPRGRTQAGRLQRGCTLVRQRPSTSH